MFTTYSQKELSSTVKLLCKTRTSLEGFFLSSSLISSLTAAIDYCVEICKEQPDQYGFLFIGHGKNCLIQNLL